MGVNGVGGVGGSVWLIFYSPDYLQKLRYVTILGRGRIGWKGASLYVGNKYYFLGKLQII